MNTEIKNNSHLEIIISKLDSVITSLDDVVVETTYKLDNISTLMYNSIQENNKKYLEEKIDKTIANNSNGTAISKIIFLIHKLEIVLEKAKRNYYHISEIIN